MLTVQAINQRGEVEYEYTGPTDAQLLAMHELGKCHENCGYCAAEAAEWLLRTQYENKLAPTHCHTRIQAY